MQVKMKKFLNILKAELEELKEDLVFFGELHKKRERNGEITTYVFLENMNLITDEISGIQGIVNNIDRLIGTDYSTLDEMVEDLDKKIKVKIKESAHSDAAYQLVSRKLQKVKKYVMDET